MNKKEYMAPATDISIINTQTVMGGLTLSNTSVLSGEDDDDDGIYANTRKGNHLWDSDDE